MRKILIGLLILGFGAVVFTLSTQKEKVDTKNLRVVDYAVNEDPNINRGIVFGKWGLSDKEGNILLDYEYEFIDTFTNNGLAIVKKDGKYGFINREYKVIVPIKYNYASPFIYGMAIVTAENGKKGIIDINGKFVVEPKDYDYISNFDMNGNARAENFKEKKTFIINRKGEVIKEL